jgi:CcmD family protein
MIVSPIYYQEAQEAPEGVSTPYDSTWATSRIPEQGPVGTEKFMLAEDKLFVVLAVVLIIWAGLAFYLFKTDRKILAMEKVIAERSAEGGIPESIQD